MSKGMPFGSRRRARLIAIPAALALVAAACGSDDDSESSSTSADSESTESDSAEAVGQASGDVPTIAVTTNVLGDVVSNLVCDAADVVTLMPVGADPHDFQISAQEAAQLREADVIIVNGANFEEGLTSAIESAESDGIQVYEAISTVQTIEYGEGGHNHSDEDHSDESHSDEDHSDDGHDDHDDHEGHDHSGDDPHFFTDVGQMMLAAEGITAMLLEIDGIDTATVEECSAAYMAELETADGEVEALIASIPDDGRIMVTNHEAFGYFADRHEFEVVGTVIPSGSTGGAASAGELAELAGIIEAEGVPAIFGDTSAPTDVAEALAAEVGGDVEVVELYTESLGEPGSEGETYIAMVVTNAERISGALA